MSVVADSWRNALGGPAHSVSSRLVEQANIRAGLKRRYLLFGTISTFQAARMAAPSHRFRCLREIHVPTQWCCFACSSFEWCTGWGYFSLVFCCCLASSFWCCCVFPLLFSGAAFLSLLWVGFAFSSVGWCCLASSFLWVVVLCHPT